jgi:PAS domain-containing protein
LSPTALSALPTASTFPIWVVTGALLMLLSLLLLWSRYRIGQLQRVAEKRHQAHRFFQGITDALGEGVIVLDRSALCIFVNPEAARLLNRTPQ